MDCSAGAWTNNSGHDLIPDRFGPHCFCSFDTDHHIYRQSSQFEYPDKLSIASFSSSCGDMESGAVNLDYLASNLRMKMLPAARLLILACNALSGHLECLSSTNYRFQPITTMQQKCCTAGRIVRQPLTSGLERLHLRSQGLVPGSADHRFSLPGTLLNAKDLLRVLCILKRRDYDRKIMMLTF